LLKERPGKGAALFHGRCEHNGRCNQTRDQQVILGKSNLARIIDRHYHVPIGKADEADDYKDCERF
jgi:hypothetical protein